MRRIGAIVAHALLTVCLAACGPRTASNEDAADSGEATVVAALPLKRGYYVATDTPCEAASNATVVLLRRDGIGGARDFCAFEKIEQTGPDTYRVVQSCGALQDDVPPELGIVTYVIPDDTRFTSRSEHGWEHSARHCAQSGMPPEWRENDISDAVR